MLISSLSRASQKTTHQASPKEHQIEVEESKEKSHLEKIMINNLKDLCIKMRLPKEQTTFNIFNTKEGAGAVWKAAKESIRKGFRPDFNSPEFCELVDKFTVEMHK